MKSSCAIPSGAYIAAQFATTLRGGRPIASMAPHAAWSINAAIVLLLFIGSLVLVDPQKTTSWINHQQQDSPLLPSHYQAQYSTPLQYQVPPHCANSRCRQLLLHAQLLLYLLLLQL